MQSADDVAIPVIFLVGQDGLAKVFAIKLSLRFQFKPDSIHVDEGIFQSKSTILIHIIGQLSTLVGETTF